MSNTLAGWLARLETLDPSRIELGLERVRTVFDELALSIDSQVVLVAGTNGKGSTVAALQAMLLSEGATVGSYTSPHLQKFNERICFQGVAVADKELVEVFQEIDDARDNIALTYFEFVTLAAILLLSRKSPDYLIMEIGLGGRLDAVNILDADVSIITGVALDHVDWLGENLESIGYEKAGIYRKGKPAIFASPDCPDTVLAKISDLDAEPYLFGSQISWQDLDDETFYQICVGESSYSISVVDQKLPPPSVLAALSAFCILGFKPNAQTSGLLAGVSLLGRYQYAALGNTHCVLDVAHNPQAASYFAQRIASDPLFTQPAAVVGVMADKPLDEIFQPFIDLVSDWFLVEPNVARAASVKVQRQVLIDLGVGVESIHEVGVMSSIGPYLSEIEAAIVYGSFYTVGEFLGYIEDTSA